MMSSAGTFEQNDSSASQNAPEELETYLLLLLSDSNLPTGGFVASSGLESFFAHGYLHNLRPVSAMAQYGQQHQRSGLSNKRSTAPSQAQLASSTLSFAKSTLHSYCRSCFPYLVRVHTVVSCYLNSQVMRSADGEAASVLPSTDLKACMASISWLDCSYHALLLNHVARRASKAQGIALLTLYSKAFAQPVNISSNDFDGSRLGEGIRQTKTAGSARAEAVRIKAAAELIDRLKLDVRRTASLVSTRGQTSSTWLESGGQHGHLPICWAVFSACLGISLPKALFLHVFLQARSLFSSSIRLNSLGPYLAHQILRFQLRRVVSDLLDEMREEGCTQVQKDAKMLSDLSCVSEVAAQNELAPYSIPDRAMTVKQENTELQTKPLFRFTSTMMTTATHIPKVQQLRTGKDGLVPVLDDDESQGWAWDWPDEHTEQYLRPAPRKNDTGEGYGYWTRSAAPASTFPLGEIVQARHDQLHSRLFNS